MGMLATFTTRSPFSTNLRLRKRCLMSAMVWSVLTVLS